MTVARNRSAFTMAEVLVVLAIVAVVSAIAYPVFQNARRNSYRAVCFSNLKQIHTALTLYRMDQGKDGNYGTPADMGFPGLKDLSRRPFPQLACNMPSPIDCSDASGYLLAWTASEFADQESDFDWAKYVHKYEESSLVFIDAAHSDYCPISPIMITRGIAVNLQGSIVAKTHRGNPENRWYYHLN